MNVKGRDEGFGDHETSESRASRGSQQTGEHDRDGCSLRQMKREVQNDVTDGRWSMVNALNDARTSDHDGHPH